jgi:hypothetical protein
LGVEEDEPGEVGRAVGVGEDLGVEGVAEPVGGKDVEPAVADERGAFGDGVEDSLDGGTDVLGGSAASGGALLGRAHQVEQVSLFYLVELQRPARTWWAPHWRG